MGKGRLAALIAGWIAAGVLLPLPALAGSRSAVEGIVTDAQTGKPIAAADVTIVGTGWGTMSGPDGRFSLQVPAGTRSVRVFHVSYEMKTFDGVVIDPKAPVQLEAVLQPSEHRMKRIRVEEEAIESAEIALLRIREKSTTVSDGISAEQISRASSSDAGDALKRVTGVTVVENKFVQVRGLGGRYSNTVFNGSKLPSPEPNKSVVPMDLFPAGLLEKVSVSKTFTPDQTGDFAGGSVQITTKDLPSSLSLSFSSSVGYNSQSTFKSTLGYPGGDLDFLGFDDGTRGIPGLIEQLASSQAIREKGPYSDVGFTSGEIQEFGRAFSNVWSPRSRKAPLNQSYSFSLGNKTRFLGRPLGYIYSVNYSNSYGHVGEERNSYRTSTGPSGEQVLSPFTLYDVETGTNSVLWGQVLNTTLRLSTKHRLSVKTMYTRTADDEARTYEGYNADRGTDLRNLRLRYIERGLFSFQLSGDHQLSRAGGSHLSWQASYSDVTRNEPDNREVLYEKRDDDWVFFDITQSGSRFFFDLGENELGSRVDWTLPLGSEPVASPKASKLKTGFFLSGKNRDFTGRRFRFEQSDNIHEYVDLTGEPEEILAEENIAPGVFELRETTRAVDNYEASHDVQAGYFLLDLPLSSKTRVVGGLRLERSDQELVSYDPFSSTSEPVVTNLETKDLLPSLNVKYELGERTNLRGAYSRTVARPDFRELAPFEFTDFIGGRSEIGNPELKRTLVENYDLRWEKHGDGGALLAVGAFYKRFQDPIEQIIQPSATLRVSYENAESAETYGLELEWRRTLAFLSDKLRSFSINSNLTLMETEVRLHENGYSVQTSSNRSLQGQSPYVWNASLGYDNEKRGTSATLLVNVFDRRISEVGAQGLPDVYEERRTQLDLNFKQKIGSNWKLKVSGKNLLDPDYEFSQGDEIYRLYTTGRSVSVGIGYDL